MSENIDPIKAIHRIATLLNLTEQVGKKSDALRPGHYRLRACTTDRIFQCIEFGSGNISQIKQVFEELGFIIAHNKQENKVFFTVN